MSSTWRSPVRHLGYLGIALAAAGCVANIDDDELEESQVESNIVLDNGISLNGISLNGISSNGISSNGSSNSGSSLIGIYLRGITLNGVTLSSVEVRETQLRGGRSGNTITGAALVGARMKGQTSSGEVDLRIDGSAMLAAPNAEVRAYSISYASGAGWVPLCANANEAILYRGTWNLTTVRHQWDSNMFTVSCRGATFAKCTELGYKGDSSLDTYHQACVRALRADYCGDGQSHTVNGTQINIYDKLGRQLDTQNWALEANWTPDGATCIGTGRIATSLTVPNVPSCVAARATASCATTTWPSSVLIRTEVNK